MSAPSGTFELMRAAIGGDDVAFERLLEPHLDPAYRLACAMLHDPHLAEDVVQDSAFKAWRKLGQLRDLTQLRPWFLAIVANGCRSARRARGRRAETALHSEPTSSAPEDAALAGVELRGAVSAMSPDKRLVLVLHWYLDLPVAEIAAITHLSVHAAESRITRATQELRSRLEAGRGRQ